MKIFNIIGSLALATLVMTSCANHDPIADMGELGQVLPTVDWEQGSTLVKAGNYATFKAKYYTVAEKQIDHTEVWCQVKREQSAAATSKLTSGLAYTKTYTLSDTVRSAQSVATYPHSAAEWDGYEYVLTDSFPTSRTLAPVMWNTPEEWDAEKFAAYYPATFAQEFVDHMVEALTGSNTYYNDLRNVYIKYDFTAEQFAELNAKYGFNIPVETEGDKKSDAWYTTDEVDHYYYITVENDQTKYNEIANESDAPAGANVYAVYKSSDWLFSRYSDDTGGKVTTVRSEYMPYWKDLIAQIPFISWIYDSANKAYYVSFTRNYFLSPSFRVYDKDGKVGVTSTNNEITLN